MSTLALKYRPRDFSEIIGQELVVRVLRRVIQDGLPYRAYLFSGVWGSGKTSSARIFAKSINCEASNKPCGLCQNCKDVEQGENTNFYLEVDAATYGNIENIRKIQNFVQYKPIGALYTVVVLDEAHRLSKEAFDAMLKLIEDPPANAVFIFATTEHGKMPDTIKSRCLDLRFVRIQISQVVERLAHIAKKEGITCEPQVIETIAEFNQGIARDSITMLEQLSLATDKNIKVSDLKNFLGLVGVSFFELTQKIQANDQKAKHEFVETFVNGNNDFVLFSRQYLRYLRNLLCWRKGLLQNIRSEDLEEYKKLSIEEGRLLKIMVELISFAKRITYDRGMTAEDFRLVIMSL